MVFQFAHTELSNGCYGKWNDKRTELIKLKGLFANWQLALRDKGWNCLFWGNHDQPRAVSKFGDDRPAYRALSAKMLAACLYLMQGTPYIYQGEELGMTNMPFTSIEECRDIESIRAYRDLVDGGHISSERMMEYIRFAGRDNARTPMQWTDEPNAGFTTGAPWLAVNPNYREIHAQAQEKDPDSVLHFYRKLLKLRKGSAVVREGDFVLLYPESEAVFAYTRQYENETLCVLCNFTDRTIALPYPSPGGKCILWNYPEPAHAEALRPYECVVRLATK